MTSGLRLSALDQSPIRADGDAATAIAETVALAQACEALGYERYWVAEHHNTHAFAGSCPEILMGAVAAATTRIRVGSAGVLLHHYAPLKVAEQMRMLETLYPGRIDLGIGRAPGADGRTTAALQNGPKSFGMEVFPQKVDLLLRLLEDAGAVAAMPEDHPYRGIRACPTGSGLPEVWMLGSSPMGAAIAAQLGQRFAYAHFIAGDDGDGSMPGPELMASYRTRFIARHEPVEAQACVAVSVVCAPTDEEAEHVAMSRHLWVLRLLQGQHTAFLSPDAARAQELSADEQTLLARVKARCIVGGPARVRAQLLDLSTRYETRDLVIHTFTHGYADRLRSYDLIAAEML